MVCLVKSNPKGAPGPRRQPAIRWICCFLLWFTLAISVHAQQEPALPDQITLGDIEEWAWENLDEDVLNVFQELDRERITSFLSSLKGSLEGSSIEDLRKMKEPASRMLPFLLQFEETEPLALWLKTRLDLLEAAEEMQREMKPVPTRPGASPAPPEGPSEKVQRIVWQRRMESRPIPPEAEPYVRQLKPVFEQEKAPPQLVWLAELESSFNPKARSPAGARGLFQLMKPTGKRLGLSTFLPDERLHPEKSGRAAAKYLRQLREKYGDWRLALAAYNAGEGRVDSLLKKSREKSFAAISRRLPSETRLYVPKFEALLKKREGVELARL